MYVLTIDIIVTLFTKFKASIDLYCCKPVTSSNARMK